MTIERYVCLLMVRRAIRSPQNTSLWHFFGWRTIDKEAQTPIYSLNFFFATHSRGILEAFQSTEFGGKFGVSNFLPLSKGQSVANFWARTRHPPVMIINNQTCVKLPLLHRAPLRRRRGPGRDRSMRLQTVHFVSRTGAKDKPHELDIYLVAAELKK